MKESKSYTRERNALKDVKTLDDVLKKIPNKNIVEKIKKIISEYEKQYNEQIKYIDSGETSDVFAIKDIIIKFCPEIPYTDIPLCVENIQKVNYKTKIGYTNIPFCMCVMPRLQTSDITREDVQYVYNILRSKGWVWNDPKIENLGRIQGRGNSKERLRIIDNGYIKREAEVLQHYTSVSDYLISTVSSYEKSYQKSGKSNLSMSTAKEKRKSFLQRISSKINLPQKKKNEISLLNMPKDMEK